MSRKLFIISTPIGNLSDLTDRARSTLKDVDLIFAEDTRVSIKLLRHLNLPTRTSSGKDRMISCHKFNEQSRLPELEKAFEEGLDVALVSDAGTPLLSDPGQKLVQNAIELGFEICAIPGPTALIQALVGSGLNCERFSFEGFLPEKEGMIKKRLASLKEDPRTLIFYVSPHNLLKRLNSLAEILGDRRACLAKELTKLHETYFRDNLSALKNHLNEENLRGEFTLVIEGAPELKHREVDEETLKEFILMAHSQGLSVKEIAKSCQETFGIKKSDAYRETLIITGRD